MKLSRLLSGVQCSIEEDWEIKSLVRDSRMVELGDLFFAIAGSESDGHAFANQALEKGAVAVVVEKDLGLEAQILVESSHQAYGVACGNYYGNPAKSLKLIGVTGTNGKTTTAYIIKGILESLGRKTGLIGTIENLIGDVSIQAKHTTPDPFQLHGLFRRMVDAGCEFVVMEVSSHALDQERLAGCRFVAGGFSNLTQDHLDYHRTMENYYQAKKKLFDISDIAVVNCDDEYARRLISELVEEQKKVITFSLEREATILGKEITFSQKGSQFLICYDNKDYKAEFVQPGRFSVSNALMAVGLCLGAEIEFDQVVKGLGNCPSIPGRFEIIVSNPELTVIRDFAHSTDGLKKLLSTVRGFVVGRIVTIFGCAGERDRSKRRAMAKTVAAYSDLVIMTADNPRSEAVGQIFADALPGLEESKADFKIFENRLEAIHWGLENRKSGDYFILAGKGHEDYQVLDYGSINFNELEIVRERINQEARNEL